MSKLRCHVSISLDGFVAGPNQSKQNPLAQAANQYLAAGLLDELELHVVPVVLGDGARLFDNLKDAEVQLEQVRAVEAPGVTHLTYRSLK
jgi:hypothetical protein